MGVSRDDSLSRYGTESYTGWGETEAAADFAAKGSSVGAGSAQGIDMSQVPSVQDYVEDQFTVEEDALKDLVMEMKAREDPLAMYGRLEEEAGMPALRATSTTLMKEIEGLEDYLDQIEPDVSARTRESLVTESQRRLMVSEEKRPQLEKLTKLGTSLGRVGQRMNLAERGIATKTELGLRGQEMGLEPLQLRYEVLIDRNARLLTGWTIDRQTKLDDLYKKLERQQFLSDREWGEANELAKIEKQYQHEMEMLTYKTDKEDAQPSEAFEVGWEEYVLS